MIDLSKEQMAAELHALVDSVFKNEVPTLVFLARDGDGKTVMRMLGGSTEVLAWLARASWEVAGRDQIAAARKGEAPVLMSTPDYDEDQTVAENLPDDVQMPPEKAEEKKE